MTNNHGQDMEDPQLLAYARAGAKLQLVSILAVFPELLTELLRERKVAQAAHARAIKQARAARPPKLVSRSAAAHG